MATEKEIQHAAVAALLSISFEPMAQLVLQGFQHLNLQADESVVKLVTLFLLGTAFWISVRTLDRLLLLGPLRKINNRLRPPTDMEGFWYQHVKGIPERPHSICQIRFDWLHYCWVYEGAGLNAGGELAARWRSESIYYDDDTSQWFLSGRAHLMVKSDNVDNFRMDDKDGNVLTILTLGENKEDAVAGVCIDYGALIGSQGGYFSTTMTRITADDFRKVRPGKKRLKHFQELKYVDYKRILEVMTGN